MLNASLGHPASPVWVKTGKAPIEQMFSGLPPATDIRQRGWPGVIHKDSNVTVTAFPARHEDMANSFSFRFDTPDRAIVISGDTTPTQTLIDHSRDCDILIHEAYSMASFRSVSPRWQEYRRRAHTSSVELAEIANTVKPGLLVLYHCSNAGGPPGIIDTEDVLVDEIRHAYRGNVVAGHDLDVF